MGGLRAGWQAIAWRWWGGKEGACLGCVEGEEAELARAGHLQTTQARESLRHFSLEAQAEATPAGRKAAALRAAAVAKQEQLREVSARVCLCVDMLVFCFSDTICKGMDCLWYGMLVHLADATDATGQLRLMRLVMWRILCA